MALVARVANGVLVPLGGGGRPSRRHLMPVLPTPGGPMTSALMIRTLVTPSQDSMLNLFADDMLLFKPITSVSDFHHLQDDIKSIKIW